jgi:hypothetical protein
MRQFGVGLPPQEGQGQAIQFTTEKFRMSRILYVFRLYEAHHDCEASNLTALTASVGAIFSVGPLFLRPYS